MHRWEALLFYLYTGTVAFAPLRSRGEKRRREYIESYQRKNPRRPAPCSCKSIYRLACQVCSLSRPPGPLY